MKKKYQLFLCGLFLSTYVFSQVSLDSVFTINDILLVNIKEVTEKEVKFAYPDEDILNTISINSVLKIVFKSGRVQTFSEAKEYQTVKNGLDWEHVTVIQAESDVKNLYQLDQVNAKAKAATGFGSVGRMENRAMRKLLIETAMNGGNIVYLTQQNSSTRTMQSTSSSVVGGIAYGSKIPNYDSFMSMINDSNSYRYIEKHSLGVNDNDMKISMQNGESIVLKNIEKSGHLIYLNANFPKINDTKFRVSFFDREQIILVYRTKKLIVNLVLTK